MSWNEVREALALMKGEDDEHGITEYVFNNAATVAEAMTGTFPAPKLWNHGRGSVVFDWGSFKLTITPNRIIGRVSDLYAGPSG